MQYQAKFWVVVHLLIAYLDGSTSFYEVTAKERIQHCINLPQYISSLLVSIFHK
jgi:hypothetical protein